MRTGKKKKSNPQMTVSHTASCLHRKRGGPGWSRREVSPTPWDGRTSISSWRMWKSFEFPLFSSVPCTKYYIFKHIFTEFAQIENGYKLQPGLARLTVSPPPTHWGQVWQLLLFTSMFKKVRVPRDPEEVYKTAKHHQFIQVRNPGNRYQLVHVLLPE